MHKIFQSYGKLHVLTDSNGEPVKHNWTRNVFVNARYELKPSPQQPLILDIYGYDLMGWGGRMTEKLELENGVVLKGRVSGGGLSKSGEPPKLRKIRMFNIEESKIELYPDEAKNSSSGVDLDAAIFGIVSSDPLAKGAYSKGAAHPGFPFSYSDTFPKAHRGAWSTQALRLEYRGIEICFAQTSKYWKALIDETTLQHDSIVGVRRKDHGIMEWGDMDRVLFLLQQFIGWINHCTSPVFHIKGYLKGKLVYRGYNLYPHSTVHREHFSWLPWHGIDVGDGQVLVQGLFDRFVAVWEKTEREKDNFNIALEMLRSRQKGSPLNKPAIGYLRDTFTACAILERMLTKKSSASGRQAQIARCLRVICVEDILPSMNKENLDHIIQECPQLWWANKQKKIQEQEKANGTLSRPLANMENWMLHLDDPHNTKRLLDLPWSVQQYLLEVSIWLADLMVLKVVDYSGFYLNRLTGETEIVPWEK